MKPLTILLIIVLVFCAFSYINTRYFSTVENMPVSQLTRFTLFKDVAPSAAVYKQTTRSEFVLKKVDVMSKPRGFPDIDTQGLLRDASGNWFVVKAAFPIDIRALTPSPGSVFIVRNKSRDYRPPAVMQTLSIGTISELAQYMNPIDYFL